MSVRFDGVIADHPTPRHTEMRHERLTIAEAHPKELPMATHFRNPPIGQPCLYLVR